MSVWVTVALSAAAGYALKFAGYVVPARFLEGRLVSRVVALLPVALLAALVAIQAFTDGSGALALDARAAAVAVALIALAVRAPFVVVVALAAATAAALRALSWA